MKNKTWEKERRDRLNKSFDSLAKLLPNYDPSITWTKIEIIQKSIAHIEHLRQRTEKYIAAKDPEALKNHKELTEALKCYQIRNGQLSELLKTANITLPSFNLPKFLLNNPNIYEEIRTLESNVENIEIEKGKSNDENSWKQKPHKTANDIKDKLIKTDQILKLNNNKLITNVGLKKNQSFPHSKDEKTIGLTVSEGNPGDALKETKAQCSETVSGVAKVLEPIKLSDKNFKTTVIPCTDVTNAATVAAPVHENDENDISNPPLSASITSASTIPTNNSKFSVSASLKNLPIVIKSSVNIVPQSNPIILPSGPLPVPFITLPPGNLPAIIKFENISQPPEKKSKLDILKPQTGVKTIKILPQPTVKLYYPSVDGKIPIPAIKKKLIVKTKKIRKKRKCDDLKNISKDTKKVKLVESDEIINGKKLKSQKELNSTINVSAYTVDQLCKTDEVLKFDKLARENREKGVVTVELHKSAKNENLLTYKKLESEDDPISKKLTENSSSTSTLTESESIKENLTKEVVDSLQLKLPNVNTHIRTVSPTAAFLKSFPKVASVAKNISEFSNDNILYSTIISTTSTSSTTSTKTNENVCVRNIRMNDKELAKDVVIHDEKIYENLETSCFEEKHNHNKITTCADGQIISCIENHDKKLLQKSQSISKSDNVTNLNLNDKINNIIQVKTLSGNEKQSKETKINNDISPESLIKQDSVSASVFGSNSFCNAIKSITVSTNIAINTTSKLLYTANTKPVQLFSPYFDSSIQSKMACSKNIPVSISSLNLSTQGPICTPLPLESVQTKQKADKVPFFNFSIPSITSNITSLSKSSDNLFIPTKNKTESKITSRLHKTDPNKTETTSNVCTQKPNIDSPNNKMNNFPSTSTSSLVSELFPYTPLTLPNMWNTVTKSSSHSITDSTHPSYTTPFYLDSLPVFNPNLSTASFHNNTESTKVSGLQVMSIEPTKNSTDISNSLSTPAISLSTSTSILSNVKSLSCKNNNDLILSNVSGAKNISFVTRQKDIDSNIKLSNCFEPTNLPYSKPEYVNTSDVNQFPNTLNSYPAFTFSLSSNTQTEDVKSSNIKSSNTIKPYSVCSSSIFSSIIKSTNPSLANSIPTTSTNTDSIKTFPTPGKNYNTICVTNKSTEAFNSNSQNNTLPISASSIRGPQPNLISNQVSSLPSVLAWESKSKSTLTTLSQPFLNFSSFSNPEDNLIPTTSKTGSGETISQSSANKENLLNNEKIFSSKDSLVTPITSAENGKSKIAPASNTISNNKMCNTININPEISNNNFTISSLSHCNISTASTTTSTKTANIDSIREIKKLQPVVFPTVSTSAKISIKVSNSTSNLENVILKPELNALQNSNLLENSNTSNFAPKTNHSIKIGHSEDYIEKSLISNNLTQFPSSNVPPWNSNLLENNSTNNYLNYEIPACSYSGFSYNTNCLTQNTQSQSDSLITVKEKLNKPNVSGDNYLNFVSKTETKGKDIYSVSNLFETKPKNSQPTQPNFQPKLNKQCAHQITHINLNDSNLFSDVNKCKTTQIQTNDCTFSKLVSKNTSTSAESSLSKPMTLLDSCNLNVAQTCYKTPENTTYPKPNFSNENPVSKITTNNQISSDNNTLSKSKKIEILESNAFNEISVKERDTTKSVNTHSDSNNKNSQNFSDFSTLNNLTNRSITNKETQNSHSVGNSVESVRQTNGCNLPAMKVIPSQEAINNCKNPTPQKTKSLMYPNSSQSSARSYDFPVTNSLYSSINNNMETNSTWTTSGKHQKENVDAIIPTSDSFGNSNYSTSNCGFYSNSKNYYYPIQGENSANYNSYTMASGISQSNSYNSEQTTHGTPLISYPNMKSDLSWMAPPHPTIPPTPLPTTDYNMFSFSLTPTTNSYVTTANQYATTNFSFSLTTPKSSALLTSSTNDKLKNCSSKAVFSDQSSSSVEFGLNFNSSKYQATEPTNFQFSLQKSSNKSENDFMTSNIEKSNYNFSIDSQLNSKNEVNQTNVGIVQELNSVDQQFKVPSSSKIKSKVLTTSKSEKRQSEHNKGYYDCEINKRCPTAKTQQKNTVNWMTSGTTASASEYNSSVFEDFNNQLSISNINSNNNVEPARKSSYYPPIDESIVTWSPNKMFDHSMQNYNHQHYYGSSNEYQVENDFVQTNYTSNVPCKQIKTEKQSSKEQNNVNNFFSIKQFVDQTSSSTPNQSKQKNFINYNNVRNQEQENQQIHQRQVHSQQSQILMNKHEVNSNEKKIPVSKLKDQNRKDVTKTTSQNPNKFNEIHLTQQQSQQQRSQQSLQKSTQPLPCNYSAESLISKKEKTSKIFPINYNNAFDSTNSYNPHCNSLIQNNDLIDQQNYTSNYFPSYSSTNNNINPHNFTSEIDYLGASIFNSTESNNDSFNKSNSTSFLKDTKKSNFISNYPTSSTVPNFSHSHHSSYEPNYLSVPPLISSATTNENYDSTYPYSNNTSSSINNSAGVSNNYQYGSWNATSKQYVIGSQNNGNTAVVQYPQQQQQQNLSNSNMNSEQTTINTHSQSSSAGNLPNFNLSSICPEINDKVCPNSNNIW